MKLPITAETADWLREIVGQGSLDEEELDDWVDSYLGERYEDNDYWVRSQLISPEEMERLKARVEPYRYDPTLPPLPKQPNGSLYGVGFIYDEDDDDRVLIAIDSLKESKDDLVALAEHEGEVAIYTRLPLRLHNTSISVEADEWCVTEYVPYKGQWVEANHSFIRECVAKVIRRKTRNLKNGSW